MLRPLSVMACLAICVAESRADLDGNTNGLSDVWEMVFAAGGLLPDVDTDGDGWSNRKEAAAGTDPKSGRDHPAMGIQFNAGLPVLSWQSAKGKQYALLASSTLQSFTPTNDVAKGSGGPMTFNFPQADAQRFFQIRISDVDTDADGVNDWEESAVGFDPTRTRTGRVATLDAARIAAGLTAANTITAAVYDNQCSERWPDSAILVLRRAGGLQPLTVNFTLDGTAVRGTDYLTVSGNSVSFGPGQREVFLEITPIADSLDAEADETVILTVTSGSGYSIGTSSSATATILNQPESAGPSAKEAARFLLQATFGPNQDSTGDADQIPENVEEVMSMGYSAWIDAQLERPVGTILPMVQWQLAQPGTMEIYNDKKQNAWWGRAMELPLLRPDSTTPQLSDPLRQRVGFALSQIFVISDRMERLAGEPQGMSHFYDTLLQNAFGNYRTLLKDVSLHPCMGHYLSHLQNKKADPVARTFPDENYAREVMQLFSIGLWMLNPDGSRQLDGNGQPIPTYDNTTITELAKVFTGLSYSKRTNGTDNTNFTEYNGDLTKPLMGFDAFHDLGPKTLLLGTTTPARTASGGTATMADVDALMTNLFNHPNVGPFIGKQLIQRLVTSNPSPAYIARVSAAFDAAPRGDMGRVVKAILLDPEARDFSKTSDPTFGKVREPFLRTVNVARAFNAASVEGWYYLDAFSLDHVQEPLKAPSVFNYYLPTYSPPGALAQSGLVAPELQIVNASSGVTAPNYFWTAISGGLHRWGNAYPGRTVTLNLTQETAMNASGSTPLDPDPLIRRLDLVLTGGSLSARSFQIIREAMHRAGSEANYNWQSDRLKLAIYLIVCSPEFAVQH